jgi:2-deoxy-D-gluconate 3-dehydrogenase
VDVLVNNAGIFPNQPITAMEPADFDRVIAVNLRGLFLCTKYAAQAMIEQGRGGRIINVTSIDALHPSMVGLAHYDASKHGAWGFTKTSALELAPHGIWVNAIAPGGVATPGVAAMQAAAPAPEGVDPEAAIQAFLEAIPMGRMGDPDDIGRTALFLASDLASYFTGSQIVVDGGALLT